MSVHTSSTSHSCCSRLFEPSNDDQPYRVIHINPPAMENVRPGSAPRGLTADQQRQFDFIDNSVNTAKYNLISFIPRSLMEQFRRIANIYFLLISFLMLIGTYTYLFDSPLTPWSTLLPLLVVLAISMGKEGIEDLKRHRADKLTNNRLCERLVTKRGGSKDQSLFEAVPWKYLLPGDVIKVSNNDELPADTIILCTSDAQNRAFIETSNIDGETNLKVKSSVHNNFNKAIWTSPEGLIG